MYSNKYAKLIPIITLYQIQKIKEIVEERKYVSFVLDMETK